MNLKKTWKRFWTLSRHREAGFTLVELIVVIAILAILAGIAVPAYSSYVTRANKSADKQTVSDIKYALELAQYTDKFNGAVSVVLYNDGTAVALAGDDASKAWANTALTNAFGSDYASSLQLKHDGWGNGVAVANVMISALKGDDISAAMANIYGDASNLSFTEEIPELLTEIRNVAEAVAGAEASDAATIGIVNGAAAITSGWDVSSIQTLWMTPLSYTGGAYSNYDTSLIPVGTSAYDTKLTIAGVIKAKNTCLAMYAAENGYSQYYNALANYSVEGSIVPMDLTYAANNEQARLAETLGLDINNTADQTVLGNLRNLLSGYYSAVGANGKKVYANDAAAYYAMMDVVDTMNEQDTLSEDNLDEYFASVSGPATMFQQLVNGSLTLDKLESSLSGLNSAENAVTITAVSGMNGITIVVGPTTVLD